jgi:hypothetical protein
MNDNILNFEETAATAGAFQSVMKTAGASTTQAMWMVPFEAINVYPGFNPRDKESADYKNDVQSIKEQMLMDGWRKSKPAEVFVVDGKIYLKDGHTRYEGAGLARAEGAEITHVPAIPVEKGTTMEELTVGLVLSNTGARLSPLGQSVVVGRLHKQFGKTKEEIATRLSMSKKYVGQLLMLDSCPNELKAMISRGLVSSTLVIEALLRLKDGAKVLAEIRAAQEGTSKGDGEGEDGEGEGEGEGNGETAEKKVTAKATRTPEQKEEAAQKKEAPAMFKAIAMLMELHDKRDKAVEENEEFDTTEIDSEIKEVLDMIFVIQVRVEKAAGA